MISCLSICTFDESLTVLLLGVHNHLRLEDKLTHNDGFPFEEGLPLSRIEPFNFWTIENKKCKLFH